MEIKLELESAAGSRELAFAFGRMVNAGYTGRNQAEVQRHIDELAAKGIPGPKKIPTLFPVICQTLLSQPEIEVYGEETSGEVEYVLLVQDPQTIYVGLGSDHTDRHLEETDIPRAKQITPNLISAKVWPLSEVKDHWDRLLIRSSVVNQGRQEVVQEGRLELMMAPDDLMSFVQSQIGPLDNTVIYSGTLGTLSGEFAFGRRFICELLDEELGRRLDLAYDIKPLDYYKVEG